MARTLEMCVEFARFLRDRPAWRVSPFGQRSVEELVALKALEPGVHLDAGQSAAATATRRRLKVVVRAVCVRRIHGCGTVEGGGTVTERRRIRQASCHMLSRIQ